MESMLKHNSADNAVADEIVTYEVKPINLENQNVIPTISHDVTVLYTYLLANVTEEIVFVKNVTYDQAYSALMQLTEESINAAIDLSPIPDARLNSKTFQFFLVDDERQMGVEIIIPSFYMNYSLLSGPEHWKLLRISKNEMGSLLDFSSLGFNNTHISLRRTYDAVSMKIRLAKPVDCDYVLGYCSILPYATTNYSDYLEHAEKQHKEYYMNPMHRWKYDWLMTHYSSYRRSLNDGNGYYRAVYFNIFEQMITQRDPHTKKNLILTLYNVIVDAIEQSQGMDADPDTEEPGFNGLQEKYPYFTHPVTNSDEINELMRMLEQAAGEYLSAA